MKKPFTHEDLSGKVCTTKGCNKRIKANLLARKPGATKCYDCYRQEQETRGNKTTTAREVRQGKETGRKKGRYGVASREGREAE